MPKLGEIGEERAAHDGTDAGNRAQKILFRTPDRALPDGVVQIAIDGRHTAFEPADVCRDVPADRGAGVLQSIALGGHHVHELTAARHEGLELLLGRIRQALLEEDLWQRLRDKVDSAEKLAPEQLAPIVAGVWACGAYHSRGRFRAMPWSRLLRDAKEPPKDEEERTVLSKVACGFLCRYIAANTPVLRQADLVVAIPPDPERYARRGMSLPDSLAAAVERQLALVWPMEALVKTKSIQLRGLSWPDRRQAIKGSMATGDAEIVKDRCVLLVDDVTTSGATLLEAATVLRGAGARDVLAVTLCHTEG